MGILAELRAAVDEVERVVGGLEPACLEGADAAGLLELFARGERLCGAGKSLAAARVADSGWWRQEGERSAAHWLARRSGTTVGVAAASIETAQRIEALPAVDEAYRAGRLSEVQAREIASVAAGQPAASTELLAVAGQEGVQGLRDACRRVAAAAVPDELARQAAIHRGRYLKTWVDPDGAGRLDARMTVEALATVMAGIERFEAGVFEAARASGTREPYHAYAADALVALAAASRGNAGGGSTGRADAAGAASGAGGGVGTSAGGGGCGAGGSAASRPAVAVHLLVHHAALIRGHTEAGEICEIAGVGPVPVATAQAMMADAILAAVVTDGVDVYSVAHLGRTVTAHQRSALEVRDRHCVVPGCPVRDHLEIDHVQPWAATRVTKLDALARLCRFHHHQKTYDGYTLEGGPGHWRWLKPDGTPAQTHPDGQPARI